MAFLCDFVEDFFLWRRTVLKIPVTSYGKQRMSWSTGEKEMNRRFWCIKVKATRGELDPVLGVGWRSRSFSTSTVCKVDPTHPIGITLSCKVKFNFNHNECPCGTWQGNHYQQPAICSPRKHLIPGPPWLELSFCKRCINTSTFQVNI